MGNFNYRVMLLRLKILFFVRDRLFKKIIRRKGVNSWSVFINNAEPNKRGELTDSTGEYHIHIREKQITNFLN